MKISTTSERLKDYMRDHHLRQVDIIEMVKPLCDGLGIKFNKSDLSQYVSGKTEPGQDKLVILSKALKVSEPWLMGYDVPPEPQKEPKNQKQPELIPVEYNPTHKIPVLGRISAGLPLYAEEHIEGYVYTELNGGNDYFGLRVVGDSMNAARICEGDIIIVRQQEQVEDGEIAVVMVDDEDATVKRFHREGRNVFLSPQSFNPANKVQVYDLKETNIRIIGKVVRVMYDP